MYENPGGGGGARPFPADTHDHAGNTFMEKTFCASENGSKTGLPKRP